MPEPKPKAKRQTKAQRRAQKRAEIEAILAPLGYSLDDIIPPKKSLSTSSGNDCIQTPDSLALAVVRHFHPWGRVLEPCAGEGAFLRAFTAYNAEFGTDAPITRIDSFEKTQGSDFLTIPDDDSRRWNWSITNPPWSLFREFNRQAMRRVENIVWIDKMNAFGFTGRIRDLEAAGYAIREYALIDQPPPPWPSMGLQLAAIHLSKTRPGETLGAPKITRIDWKPEAPAK
jgi:hypothetical protein